MRKLCPICESHFESKTSAKFCSDECRDKRRSEGQNPQSRHYTLIRTLESERVPYLDLLWKFDFYVELIAGGCTYCNGPLGQSGHGLDKIINSLGHRCWNVTAACPVCNRIKSDSKEDGFSFNEMAEFIGPAVRAVRNNRKK
jgi:hypothetical protein